MPIFRHKLSLSSLNCILICQLLILKLSCATSVDSIVLNGQPAASSSLSETLEFSDSIPGFEHHEFQSLRIKPLNADNKLLNNPHNKSTVTKVTTSATLAATLLKRVGLPSTPKYVYAGSADRNQHNSPSNKTILNSVLIKRINRQPTSATLTASSSVSTSTTTPLPYDDAETFRKPVNKLPGQATGNGKLLRLSKKKKAKQSIFKSLNSSSLLLPPTTSPATPADIEDTNNNELTSSSIAPNGVQATEQHSVLINHGGGAVSTIRRTLNAGSSPAFEHLQIGFPASNNHFPSDPFPNFGLNVDLTPPPLPQIVNHNDEPLNHRQPPPPAQSIGPAKPAPPIQQPRDEQPPPIAKPIFSSNRNGRLRGAHKKQVHVNRRKSAALVKDNELNNQIVPVSVGLPNSFQNVKPADLPNFAELSFFGYRSEQNAPRSFNDREHYTTNNNNNNLNSNFYNRENGNSLPPPPPPPPPMNQPPANGNHQPATSGSPRNEFNFNLHPFFANERRNQPPNSNDLYQFFDTPFMPINPPPAIHNLNNLHYHTNHQTMHHHNGDNHQLNHQIFHHQPMDNEIGAGPLHPINAPNGHFQRRKLTLSNGNTAPMVNEISNNNLGYGYPSYGLYKGDEEAGIKYPKIFRFVDGRVNLNDFEKEKKLGKIEFGKSVVEDGSEYQFEHVRRDLFLILHGGSFNY